MVPALYGWRLEPAWQGQVLCSCGPFLFLFPSLFSLLRFAGPSMLPAEWVEIQTSVSALG